MRAAVAAAVVASWSSLAPGCASIVGHAEAIHEGWPACFTGTRADFGVGFQGGAYFGFFGGGWFRVLAIVDLPLSAALDVALLPCSATRAVVLNLLNGVWSHEHDFDHTPPPAPEAVPRRRGERARPFDAPRGGW